MSTYYIKIDEETSDVLLVDSSGTILAHLDGSAEGVFIPFPQGSTGAFRQIHSDYFYNDQRIKVIVDAVGSVSGVTGSASAIETIQGVSGEYSIASSLIKGDGFVSAFDSDYNNTSRFGQAIAYGQYQQSATVNGSPRNDDTSDNFARTSHPVLALGQPNVYGVTGGFTLDIYTFHGAGITAVEVVCDGGTAINAERVNTSINASSVGYGGHYQAYIGISSGTIPYGTTSEIRVTSKPINGYDRTVMMKLSAVTGENKVSIGPDSTICSAYDTVMSSYDPTKRNIIELTTSGGYTLGIATDYSKPEYGWIEVITAPGVTAELDMTYGSNNHGVRPLARVMKWVGINFKNFINEEDPDWQNFAGNGRIYVEDGYDNARWWFEGCTLSSNWVSGGTQGISYWELDGTTAGGILPNGMDIVRSGAGQQLFYTNCVGQETNNGFHSSLLVNGCTLDYCYQDAYTNVKALINSAATNKITPAFLDRHADHYQLFLVATAGFTNNQGVTFSGSGITNSDRAVMMNYLLYGYVGEDINRTVQQAPGFFGTGNEYYVDIAHAASRFYGATAGDTSAQMGVVYDHILNIGMTSENSGVTVRSDGRQLGPVLFKDCSYASHRNNYLSILDIIPGSTNEFREINCTPGFEYDGNPNSDERLRTWYTWHVPAGSALDNAGFGNIYLNETDPINGSDFHISETATGVCGGADVHTLTAFGRGTTSDWYTAARFAYTTYSAEGVLITLVLSHIADRADGVAFIESGGTGGWWMKIETDQGYAYSAYPLATRADPSTLIDAAYWNNGAFGGITLSAAGITGSATGVTLSILKVP